FELLLLPFEVLLDGAAAGGAEEGQVAVLRVALGLGQPELGQPELARRRLLLPVGRRGGLQPGPLDGGALLLLGGPEGRDRGHEGGGEKQAHGGVLRWGWFGPTPEAFYAGRSELEPDADLEAARHHPRPVPEVEVFDLPQEVFRRKLAA